jgi:hypothetical protein
VADGRSGRAAELRAQTASPTHQGSLVTTQIGTTSQSTTILGPTSLRFAQTGGRLPGTEFTLRDDIIQR